jgi:hypothetical protein
VIGERIDHQPARQGGKGPTCHTSWDGLRMLNGTITRAVVLSRGTFVASTCGSSSPRAVAATSKTEQLPSVLQLVDLQEGGHDLVLVHALSADWAWVGV